MARLDALGPAKEIAQIGSAIGREFTFELLSAVGGQCQEEVRAELDKLVNAGLIFQRGTPPQATFLFKHALIQDAAYGTLLRGQRRSIHKRIAEWLVQRTDLDNSFALPEVIARHCQEAGDDARALTFLEKAGELAEARGASQEAAIHFRQAMALAEKSYVSFSAREKVPDLCMKLGNTLMQAEGYNSAEGLQVYRKAREIAKAAGSKESTARASIEMGPMLFGACQYQEVLTITSEIEPYCAELRPQTRVQLMAGNAIAKFILGDLAGAWQEITRTIGLDDEVQCGADNPFGGGDPAIVARSYARWIGSTLGHLDTSLKYADEGVAIARMRRHAFSLAWALQALGFALTSMGSYKNAMINFDEAERVCKEHGFAARIAMVRFLRGHVRFEIGMIDYALTEMRDALENWRRLSGNFHVSSHLALLASCLVRVGKDDEAESVVDEAEAIAAETGERSHFGEVLRLRGLLDKLKGHHESARRCLLQSIDWSQARKAKALELRAAIDLVRLEFEAKHLVSDLETLRSVVAWFPECLKYPDLIEARQLIGDKS
jgi:tetratricopeptide (TPR) repeat protein